MIHLDVIGLGVSTLDIVTLVDHFPIGREVQRAYDMMVQGGGPVATAMVALARLGVPSAMIDVLGDDWRSEIIREELMKEGVDTRYIGLRQSCASSTACILVTKENGNRAITFFPGTVPEISFLDSQRSVIESAKYLHINGRHWNACLQAVEWAHHAGVQVSFDGGAGRYRPEMKHLVPLTDICIVARDFAEKYTLETDCKKAAETLGRCGPRCVVITDGINGSLIYHREEKIFHQPAYVFPRTVDTTGCGDSYHGAFLFGLLREYEIEKTAAFASAVAALNSQHLGGRTGLPTFEQVRSFLSEKGVVL